MSRYHYDVLSAPQRRASRVAEVPAELDLVVETADGTFCGAIVGHGLAIDAGEKRATVTLEDYRGKQRVFALLPAAFMLDGALVTLIPSAPPIETASASASAVSGMRAKTASGSYAVPGAKAQIAKASRIWVEGIHDAALVERIWGDDLRIEGIVVEPQDGIDDLVSLVAAFRPSPTRRVGVLVDHLVPNSKESRIVAGVKNSSVLITGHPYVDIWQAVKPSALGIDRWPTVPRGVNWKDGICQALAVSNPREMWRQVLAGVNNFGDVEVPLLRAVEELIDFVTE